MNPKKLLTHLAAHLALVIFLSLAGTAQTASPAAPAAPPEETSRPAVHSHRPTVRTAAPDAAFCASCVRDNLADLAGPALHGRGSGTDDEYHAAQYIADKLKSYGLAPAASDTAFVQAVTVHMPANGKVPTVTKTWNVLGKIKGTSDEVILLSAHLDHLGVVNGRTYYGADDDASGVAAVMELARILAAGPQPKRTVVVALWGSEEAGFVGSKSFLQHPPFPLDRIVANLEFEMIGRPDPRLKPDQLWLSGWERTNLGPELASHGASLVADPHTAEKFFSRSDNYALAEDGIIAQTISSFGLHKDYHQPTDTVDKIDFRHMDRAVASLIAPIQWLANTTFKPQWVKGKKP